MNRYLRVVFIAGAVTAAASLGAGKSVPEQTLHVRVYDRAQVPAETLRCAMVEAGRIFHSARIEIVWERPAAESPQDRGLDWRSSAARRNQPERHYVAVRILKGNARPGMLGFSLPFAQTGAQVVIFYDRIAFTTQSWNVTLDTNVTLDAALGCALAHEIGHVLLRSSEHSRCGLMQAQWDQDGWRLASQGLLGFSPEQKKEIRGGAFRFNAPAIRASALPLRGGRGPVGSIVLPLRPIQNPERQ